MKNHILGFLALETLSQTLCKPSYMIQLYCDYKTICFLRGVENPINPILIDSN